MTKNNVNAQVANILLHHAVHKCWQTAGINYCCLRALYWIYFWPPNEFKSNFHSTFSSVFVSVILHYLQQNELYLRQQKQEYQ